MLGMARIGFGRIRHYLRSGARLYIPQKVLEDSAFPFRDGDLVKFEIRPDGSVNLKGVEWWEMIDWDSQLDSFNRLPDEVKASIRKARLAPKEEAAATPL